MDPISVALQMWRQQCVIWQGKIYSIILFIKYVLHYVPIIKYIIFQSTQDFNASLNQCKYHIFNQNTNFILKRKKVTVFIHIIFLYFEINCNSWELVIWSHHTISQIKSQIFWFVEFDYAYDQLLNLKKKQIWIN